LRLLSPRHPSCALCSLVISLLAASLPREDQGPARPPWLTGCPPDDTLPTSLACAYAVVKDHSSWWSRSGSNRRHPACKAGALPAELRPRYSPARTVVGLGRFELPTPRLSSVCSNQLSYRPIAQTQAPQDLKEPAPKRSVPQNRTASPHDCETPFDLLLLHRCRRSSSLERR